MKTLNDYDEVTKLHKGGMSLKDACEKADVKIQSYYGWKSIQKRGKKTARTRTKKARVTTIEVAPMESRIIAFYGTPREIMTAIGSLQ